MPKFSVTIPHPMTADAAAERLQGFTARLKEQYGDQISGLEHEWLGHDLKFAFTTFGMKIVGLMKIGDQQVVVEGDLPFAATMFRGKIETTIREQLERLLGSDRKP